MMRSTILFAVLASSCATKPATAPAPQVDCAKADGGALLDAAVANPARSEKHRARDQYRHPKETLAFIGVKPTDHVVELWPGGGWYTEILAPYVVSCGALVDVSPKRKEGTPPPPPAGVTALDIDTSGDFNFGPDNSADDVLTFRNIHNWMDGGYESKMYAAAFKVLKPGGVFGVEEHRAKPGTDDESSKKSGYVDEDAVIKRITAAGFVLEAKSEINANPKDTKDYDGGVWTLPPSLQKGDVDKAKYLAIGESDRMTLRFKKPK
jgi:predicted methyltransferase